MVGPEIALGCAGPEDGGKYTKLIVFPPVKVTLNIPVNDANEAVLIVKLLALKPEIELAEAIGQVYAFAGLKLDTDKDTKFKVIGEAEQVIAPVEVILSQPEAFPAVPVALFISNL